jgi:hypothetical protein
MLSVGLLDQDYSSSSSAFNHAPSSFIWLVSCRLALNRKNAAIHPRFGI